MSIFDIEKGRKEQKYISVPGLEAQLPVTVVRSREDGSNVLITAGIHNEEYCGIETANRLASELTPDNMRGCVAIVHVCNPSGFTSVSRDVVPEDGQNLNRCFPGSADSGATHRLAHFLSEDFLRSASLHLDLHCGGGREQLTPHVYYQAMGGEVLEAASKTLASLVDTGYMVAVHELTGSAFSHASQFGVPSVLIERGGMAQWTEEEIQAFLSDVRRILCRVGVLDTCTPQAHIPREIIDMDYSNAPVGGCWYPAKSAGDVVVRDEQLGSVKDNFGRTLFEVKAPADSVILFQLGSFSARKGEILAAYGLL